jgi:hypothetical protein
MGQFKINCLVADCDKKIAKAERDMEVLSGLFKSTDNESIAYGYNEQIIKTAKELDDLKAIRDYYTNYGKVCRLIASF